MNNTVTVTVKLDTTEMSGRLSAELQQASSQFYALSQACGRAAKAFRSVPAPVPVPWEIRLYRWLRSLWFRVRTEEKYYSRWRYPLGVSPAVCDEYHTVQGAFFAVGEHGTEFYRPAKRVSPGKKTRTKK